MSGQYETERQGTSATCHLNPPAFKGRDARSKWMSTGRTLDAAVSPTGGEIAAWVALRPSDNANQPPKLPEPGSSLSDRTIYFASPSTLPPPLANLYTETYTLFTSLQKIVASSIRLPIPGGGLDAGGFGVAEVWDKKGNLVGVEGLVGPPGSETVGHMRRLVMMYLEELLRLREAEGIHDELRSRYETVYNVFQLAATLYLPQDGRGEGLLGEELLDWLNDVDPQPDNSQGNEIMQSRNPWEHPSFWPYITRCILRGFQLPAASLLRTLQTHPHPPLAELGPLLAAHLTLMPRSHNTTAYPLDHQFLHAHRTWLAKFRAELAAFMGGRGRGRYLDGRKEGGEDWSSWEADIRTVVELMEGRSERLLEEAADWREAIGAYGVLCDAGLRRDDLPNVMRKILAKIPVDPTLVDDAIQSSLCSGDIVKALMGCHDLDMWLAAHLGDVFDKLALIPDDEERFDISLRDYFLLEYADLLQTNPHHPSLWRVVADYLSAAGDEGRARLRSHIVHVGLGLEKDPKGKSKEVPNGDHHHAGPNGMDVEEGDTVETEFQHFTELRAVCMELKLEEEWRTIASITADRLVRRGEYGMAATMCLQAEDGYGLSQIAEKVVDAFVQHGEEEFLRQVDTLPPSLLNEAPLALNGMQLEGSGVLVLESHAQTTVSVFASRLTFLSEFRDYLLFMSQGSRDRAAARLVNLLTSGIAPASFWAVLLVESVVLLEHSEILFSSNDTFELLRVLEEVMANASFAQEDYLGQLALVLVSQRKAEPKEGSDQRGDGKAEAALDKKQGMDEAQRKMEEVRLALARNLARALVVGFDNPF